MAGTVQEFFETLPSRADSSKTAGMNNSYVFDIDGALREMRRRGYRDVTLAGHSTGANKIAVYDHHRPRNRVQRYVLLAGGDDTGLIYASLGARRFASALTKARGQFFKDNMTLKPPAK